VDQHTPAETLIRPPERRKAGWGKRVVLLLVVAGLIGGGFAYWLHARHFETTDDAFVDANISEISAQIAGRVIGLEVHDNEVVQAGQVLVDIDPRDAQVRLDQMLAQRDEAAAQLAQARASLPVRQADMDQANANIRVAQADLDQSERDLRRYTAINPRAITAQTIDQARSTTASAQARLDAAKHAAAGMRAQLAVAQTQIDAADAALRVADANVANARLQLSYTHVVAPTAGRIARRTVQLGNYVAAGQSLLAVVQPACWITANFKESQLADMHPGETASVTVDAFAGRELAAHVDSIQSGTGSVFSSLPAENATGNYIKITQRVPVKIVLDSTSCDRLAPGMSAEPRVTVR